jgi:hypothetical protein
MPHSRLTHIICSAFSFWRVEFPDEMTGGFIPWDQMTTDTGMRVSVPIRLREVVSGAYLAYRMVCVFLFAWLGTVYCVMSSRRRCPQQLGLVSSRRVVLPVWAHLPILPIHMT